MDNKTCSKCGSEKPLNDINFAKYKNKKGEYKYRTECRECSKAMCREYKAKNKGKISEYNKTYKANHKETTREYNQKYFQTRRQIDPIYCIKANNRSRISNLLRGIKEQSSAKLLSCEYEFFIKWLEYQFDSNMNLENYGSYWHLDHVKPCASFNLTDNDEQMQCFHWTNYRPCEGKENIKKSDTVDLKIMEEQKVKVKDYIAGLEIKPELKHSLYV